MVGDMSVFVRAPLIIIVTILLTDSYGGHPIKYVINIFRYNLKATDTQAVIGCAQLDKFPAFVAWRTYHRNYLALNTLKIIVQTTDFNKLLQTAPRNSQAITA